MDIVTYALCKKMAGGKGEKGDKGDKGDQGLPGRDGVDGVTPNLQVGDVVTLEAGQQATIVRRGDDENPIFDFAIPKGDTGKDSIFVGRVDDAPDHAQVVVNDDASPYDLFFENANVSYMGDTYTSLKEKADADIEYLLREIQTQHYEGQRITATNTYQKQVRSAILKGQTLTNLISRIDKSYFMSYGTINPTWSTSDKFNSTIMTYPTNNTDLKGSLGFKVTDFLQSVYNTDLIGLKDKTFTLLATITNGTKSDIEIRLSQNGYSLNNGFAIDSIATGETKDIKVTFTIADTPLRLGHNTILASSPEYISIDRLLISETNQDIQYFTGMQSVKLPVLTTTGRNLIGSEIIAGWLNTSNGEINNLTSTTTCATKDLIKVKPATHYSIYKEYDKRVLYAQFNEKQEFINFGTYTHNGFTTDSNAMYVRWFFETPINEELKVMLYEGGYNSNISYEPYRSNILSIDGEYRGIGDVCDTVDCMTGEVVERIGEIVLDENITGSNGIIQGTLRRFDITLNKSITEKIISDKFRTGKWNYNLTINTAYEFIGYYNPTTLLLAVESSKLPTQDLSGLKEYLQSNPITVQYELAEPVIKTVDLNNQKVYSYDGTTHYTTSSGVEGHLAPILSIDIPTNLPALVSRQRDTIKDLEKENEALKEEVAVVDQQRESGDLELLSSDFDLDFRLMEIEFALDIPIAATFKEVRNMARTPYEMAKILILGGKYERSDMEYKLGKYLERKQITQAQYDELIALMEANELVV